MKEFCHTFMADYSRPRNKPSTPRGYQCVIDRCIIPIVGRMKVQDVKRPDVAALMKKLAYKQAEANRTFGVLRKMFNLAEVWGLRRFNRSFREDILDCYLFDSLDEVRDMAWDWQIEYNEERSHDSLNNLTPVGYRQRYEAQLAEVSRY